MLQQTSPVPFKPAPARESNVRRVIDIGSVPVPVGAGGGAPATDDRGSGAGQIALTPASDSPDEADTGVGEEAGSATVDVSAADLDTGRETHGESAGGRSVRWSSLLWGVVGALLFLVSIQGYELVTDRVVTVGVKIGVSVLVLAVVTTTSYVVESRFGRR